MKGMFVIDNYMRWAGVREEGTRNWVGENFRLGWLTLVNREGDGEEKDDDLVL